jgi:tetratricopeptide (TPR) repeat protein
VLTLVGGAERLPDYIDRAILEYTAASYHFEQAGHTSYRARSENNLGFVLSAAGRYEEAHEHLNHARRLFISLKDSCSVAQVDETRARVLLAEGKEEEAAKEINEAVRVLEKGGEQGTLVEALTTQGLVLARLAKHEQSLNTLRHAIETGERAGSLEYAGKAALTLLEEHADYLPLGERCEVYQLADDLLAQSQDGETLARLKTCARRIIVSRPVSAQTDEGTPTFIYAEEETAALLRFAQKFANAAVPVLITAKPVRVKKC